jgi:hypothetical protein
MHCVVNYFLPDLSLVCSEWRGYFLIPPPTRGPPFAAFTASSLRAFSSACCFALNFLVSWVSGAGGVPRPHRRVSLSFLA